MIELARRQNNFLAKKDKRKKDSQKKEQTKQENRNVGRMVRERDDERRNETASHDNSLVVKSEADADDDQDLLDDDDGGEFDDASGESGMKNAVAAQAHGPQANKKSKKSHAPRNSLTSLTIILHTDDGKRMALEEKKIESHQETARMWTSTLNNIASNLAARLAPPQTSVATPPPSIQFTNEALPGKKLGACKVCGPQDCAE